MKFAKSKGHNSSKIRLIVTTLKLDLYHLEIYSHAKFEFNICNNMEEKSGKTEYLMKFAKSNGHNSCKSRSIVTKLELDLYHIEIYSHTKIEFNTCNNMEEKSGKLKIS